MWKYQYTLICVGQIPGKSPIESANQVIGAIINQLQDTVNKHSNLNRLHRLCTWHKSTDDERASIKYNQFGVYLGKVVHIMIALQQIS